MDDDILKLSKLNTICHSILWRSRMSWSDYKVWAWRNFNQFVKTFFFCSRGFGFITFADPASVDKVLAQGTHELDGKKVRLSALFYILIKVIILVKKKILSVPSIQCNMLARAQQNNLKWRILCRKFP